MIVTSITPCIKVIKENNIGGVDMYIDLGQRVRVTDYEDNVIVGSVFFFDLGVDEEEDDMICLLLDNKEKIDIGVSYIKDLERL